MKMIRAIIRPESTEKVADAIGKITPALTKMHVFGRGRTGGLKIGEVLYDELPKTMIMVVVEDDRKDETIEAIIQAGKTGKIGDGKIFVTDVDDVYTIRTGEKA